MPWIINLGEGIKRKVVYNPFTRCLKTDDGDRIAYVYEEDGRLEIFLLMESDFESYDGKFKKFGWNGDECHVASHVCTFDGGVIKFRKNRYEFFSGNPIGKEIVIRLEWADIVISEIKNKKRFWFLRSFFCSPAQVTEISCSN